MRRLENMDDAQRAQLRERMRERQAERLALARERWERMPPQRRARLERMLERLRTETPAARERFARNGHAWGELSAPERDELRSRLRSFQSLGPQEQEEMVRRRFPGRTPDEQRAILERLRRAAPLPAPEAPAPPPAPR